MFIMKTFMTTLNYGFEVKFKNYILDTLKMNDTNRKDPKMRKLFVTRIWPVHKNP